MSTRSSARDQAWSRAKRKAGNADVSRFAVWLIHGFCALLFGSMIGILAITSVLSPTNNNGAVTGSAAEDHLENILFLAAWCPLFILAVIIRLQTPVRTPKQRKLDILLCAICAAGVLAPLLLDVDDPTLPGAFTIALIIRSVALFILVPRSFAASRLRFERIVLGWAIVMCVAFCIASAVVAQLNGVGLSSTDRLGAAYLQYKWTFPNVTAVPASLLILLCGFCRFVPMWYRVPFALLGAYVLIITQSRTSIVSLGAALCFYGLLVNYRSSRKMMALMGTLTVVALCVLPFVDDLSNIPQVQTIIERSSKEDPTTGRSEKFLDAIDLISSSPVVGHGYLSPGSRFENGFLSMMVESGFVGISLYIIFCAIAVKRAFQMLWVKDDERSQFIARTVLVLTALLYIRAFGERTHGFEVSSLLSNLWLLLVGYMFVYKKVGPTGGAATRAFLSTNYSKSAVNPVNALAANRRYRAKH